MVKGWRYGHVFSMCVAATCGGARSSRALLFDMTENDCLISSAVIQPVTVQEIADFRDGGCSWSGFKKKINKKNQSVFVFEQLSRAWCPAATRWAPGRREALDRLFSTSMITARWTTRYGCYMKLILLVSEMKTHWEARKSRLQSLNSTCWLVTNSLCFRWCSLIRKERIKDKYTALVKIGFYRVSSTNKWPLNVRNLLKHMF